ncbi:MAG TPA: BON domain-containing protein [Gemmatimonadales bacterium]|nr:BON domain-containing protein [Gemmatimonadales bacterium]
MSRNERLSGVQIFLWTTVGVGTGLVAGIALSEWVGGVSQSRVRRAAQRLGQTAPVRHTSAASARAVETALGAEPRLAGCTLEVVAISRGTVELRGWVGDRAARTAAARVARAVAGIDTVVNSILVRGEDDRVFPDKRAKDQSA